MSELEMEVKELSQVTQVRNKRVYFDVETKMHTLLRIENGESKSAIIKEMKLPPSTLATWIKDKERIAELYKHSVGHRKRLRQGSFPEVEDKLIQWIKEVRASVDYELSGPIILAKAKKIAQVLGQHGFEGSTGWLERFNNRHGINSRGEPEQPRSPDPKKTQTVEMDSSYMEPINFGGPFITPGSVNIKCDTCLDEDEDESIRSLVQGSESLTGKSTIFDDEVSHKYSNGFCDSSKQVESDSPILLMSNGGDKHLYEKLKKYQEFSARQAAATSTFPSQCQSNLSQASVVETTTTKVQFEDLFQRTIGQISAIITFTMAPIHCKVEELGGSLDRLAARLDVIDAKLQHMAPVSSCSLGATDSDGHTCICTCTTKSNTETSIPAGLIRLCYDSNPDYFLWRLIRESYSTEQLLEYSWDATSEDAKKDKECMKKSIKNEPKVKLFMEHIEQSVGALTSSVESVIAERLKDLKEVNGL